MSLSNCLKEAGDSIPKEDKAALRKKVTAIREEAGRGDNNRFILAKADADIQAIEETLGVLRAAQSDVMARAVAKTSGQGDILGSTANNRGSVESDAAQASREEKKAEVIAVLRKNSAMAESLDSGKLQVIDSSERDSLGEGWAMAFDDNGMRGAYKKSTGQAVIFSDRVTADQDAVSIGYHEMLHAAEGYAEESGSGRFDMLMGDQRSALYRRLNLLRQFGNPREKKVLQDAYDMFVASGDSDGNLATRESEWMAYAIQAIVASKAEKGSLAKWTGDARLAVQQTLRKLLRIKVTPDNLSMREFASLAELAIRETADSAGAETRQAAQDKKAEERRAAEDKKAEERQAEKDAKDAERRAKQEERQAQKEKEKEKEKEQESKKAANKSANADSSDSNDTLASRDSNNTTLLPNADVETVMRVALASEDGNASANKSLNDFFARKAGYKDAEAYNKALREEMDGFEAMLENPDALKAALYLEGEEKNRFENTTGDIKKIIGGVLAEKAGLRVLRDNKRYRLYEKTAQEMTALELVEAIDEAFDVGTAQERGARKGISLAPDSNDILASRRALSQESPGTDKYKAAVDKFGQEGMTKEARTARAEEQGFTMDAYSGSTFDIEAFDGSISSPQNDWGRGSYASTSIEDVNSNYAGIGPDLTTRIENERDNVESVMSFDEGERDVMLEEAGVPLEDYLGDPDETHWNLAAKKLVGEAELGIVYPLKIKTGNYLEMDRRTSTILEADSVGEMYERINEALFETDLYPNDQVAMDGILEEVQLYIEDQDGGETVEYPSYDLNDAVRVVVGNNGPAIGYDGEPVAPGEISAQLFSALGYEGVVDRTVNDKFGNRGALTGGMEGMDADTVHIITFPGNESNLRSTSAAFDPDNSASSDILASRSPIMFHVTNTSSVPSIKKGGLKPMQESQWVQSGTGERYGKGDVYAFESELDAQRWASKMDWDSNSAMGTGSISIVKIKNPGGEWIVDTADPLAQSSSEGQWFMRPDAIKPENIISSTPFDEKALKTFIKASNKAMDKRLQRGKDGDILASRMEARMQKAKEQGYTTPAFHGTAADIAEFNQAEADKEGEAWTRMGFHFGDVGAATQRLDNMNVNLDGDTPTGQNIIPVMLRTGRQLRLSENRSGRWGARDILQEVFKKAEDQGVEGINEEMIDAYLDDDLVVDGVNLFDADDTDNLREFVKGLLNNLGYDSIVYENDFENKGSESYIIFNPEDIRSIYAEFDPDNSGSSDLLASRKAPETPEFQRWFEGSKVVDQDGDPLVVYHATESEFTEFQVPAMFSRKRDYVESMGRPRIISAYLSIKNPADLRAMQISPSDPDFGATAEDLKRQGYDGAQYRDEAYVAFEASQIKSTENTGEFSAGSSDILASRKAPIGKTGRPYQAVRANKVKGGEDRVQTSLPSGKKNKVDYYIKGAPEDYSIGVDRILSAPEVAEKHKNTINGYDFFTPSRSDLTAEETINEFKQFMVNNLIWLHNQMDPKIRETARKWYDGARKNVDVWAARYGVESRQVAAVIANLSPQKDWFMNMSLAERIMDIHTYRQDVAADKDMNKAFDRVVLRDDKGKLIMVSKNPRKGESKKVKLVREYRSIWAAIKDAKLSDVRSLVSEDDGNLAAAIWVRMYDEAKHSRQYRMMKPTGEIIGFAMNDDGVTPASVAWGSFTEIAKAMKVLQDGSLDSVSMSLGGAHKVRNFYNNIIAPNSNLGEVTIDTHAVGAALFKPMSAKSYEVAHAFGSTPKDPKGGPDAIPEGVKRAGAGSSEANGIGGTYGIMADAYREAAAELGLLPRELQSITWEEIRVIYPASFKDDKLVNLKKINALWKQFAEGKMTLAKVRKAAYGLAKTKGNVPGWASRSNSARDDRKPNGTYSRDVYDDGVPRQVGGRGGRTAGRSRGDVARTRRASARGRAGQLDSDILGSRRNDGDQSKLEGLADLLASQSPPSGRLPTVKNALSKTKKMVTQMPELLAVLPRRALAEVAPKEMPSAAQTVRQAEQMDADRNQILSDAGEVLNLWHRWARKHKAMARKLHTLMHDTTLVGYDPSKPYKSLLTEQEYFKDMARLKKQYKAAGTLDQRKRYADLIKALETKRADERARKNAKLKLDKRWKALSPEAKKLYTQVRDEYGKQRQAMFKELKARIERAEMTETVRTAMSDKLRIAFESNTVRGPYFPLSRFGDHFVVFKKVVDGKNKVQEFRMFESEGQANEYLKEMETKHPDWVGQKGAKNKKQSTFQQVDPEYAKAVGLAIQNSSDIDRAARFELADQVWQLYLQTLPEMSIRKQSIHRGAVKGWDEDAMRGYASIALHHAHHITKLRHGDLLRGLLAQSKNEANTLRDKGYGDRINAELEKGIDWAMNPTNASWASTLTGLGFAYQLAVSPAAALINTMQTPMVGIPYIGSRFGFAKTSAEFAKATKEFSGVVAANAATRVKDKTVFLDNDLKTHWSGKLKGDELAFYNEMVRRSLFEKTRAHDLAGVSDQGMNRSMNSRVWLDRMSATFHNAEVFNREVTAMVAYRMAKKNKLSHEDALAYAYNATLDVHFDYSNAGRPRVIRLPIMKVVGQYKQYAINMSFRVLRDAYVAVNLSPEADPEVKREMIRRSLASLVLSFTFAGFQGFFAYSAIKMVYELFETLFGDEDEPKSFEGDVRQGLYNTINDHLGEDSEETARLLSDILWAGPVDTYFGGSIGLRVAPDIFRLFVQLQDNGKEGRDAYIHFMAQMAGPVVGGVAGMAFDASNLYFNDDEPWKAAEKIVPKFVRDPMKAWRYALEGATNSEGNTIIPAEDFSAWDLALQANGFAPSDLQKQYDLNRVEMTRDRALEDRKKVLMRNARKDINKNGAVSAETVRAIQRFNSMNPTIAITEEGITSSVKNKARRAALNIGGQQRDGKGPTPYNF